MTDKTKQDAIGIVTILARLVIFMGLALVANSSIAQTYQQNYAGGDYVTVYEDCDFRGKSRALTVGKYDDVRDLNIGNDKISSVAVPRGLSIVLYEDERQRGKSTVITKDVSCLNRTWNDQASSLIVNYDDSARRTTTNRGYDTSGRYDNNRGYDAEREYSNRSENNRGYQNRTGNRDNNRDGNYDRNNNYLGSQDLTRDVASIEFSNSVLTKGQRGVWIISSGRSSSETLRETGRDKSSIYLQHNRYNQRVEINMARNSVILQTGNGQRLDFPISRINTTTANRNPINNSNVGQSRRIPSACFSYRAYTTGGQGGLRFHGHDGFHQFSKRGHSDRICHNGSLVMEINKTSPDTEVIVEINGEKHRFAANEKADAYLNTWYRKKITFVVGK